MLSVVIPTYQWFDALPDSLAALVRSELLTEILICDDSSSTKLDVIASSVVQMVSGFVDYDATKPLEVIHTARGNSIEVNFFANHGRELRLRIVQNSENLGAFRNKRKAVSLADNAWVLLIDSDNVVEGEVIDRTVRGRSLDKNEIVHAVSHRRVHWESGWRDKHDKYFLPRMVRVEQFCMDRLGVVAVILALGRSSTYFLNNGNFLVHGPTYLNVAGSVPESEIDRAGAADVLLFLKYWFRTGKCLRISSFFHYSHGLRDGSFWLTSGNGNAAMVEIAEILEVQEPLPLRTRGIVVWLKVAIRVELLRSFFARDVAQFVARLGDRVYARVTRLGQLFEHKKR